METLLPIIAAVFACYFSFIIVNLTILSAFFGSDNDADTQRILQHMWLGNKLFSTYHSISANKYTNKLHWGWACLVCLCPAFNIIWMIVTLSRFFNFLRK